MKELIRQKRDGGPLSRDAIGGWIRGVVDGSIPDYESAALLMAIRAFARAEGVDAALLQEWERTLPGLPGQSEGAVRGSARKAWRFVGEMEESATAFKAAGLPDSFHRAAAELYRRLERYKDTDKPPSLEEATAVILQLSQGEKELRPC